MMRKRIWGMIGAVLAFAFILSGCASAKNETAVDRVANEEYNDMGSSVIPGDYANEGSGNDIVANENLKEGDGVQSTVKNETTKSERKLITTVYLTTETEDYDAFLTELEARVAFLGGYIETMESGNHYNDKRYASYVIRVPEARLSELTDHVSEKSNITDRSQNVQDVTLTYVDMQSRIKVYRAEEERLLEMLRESDSIEVMLSVEARLSEVQANIESMESQLRVYDNAVEYSTVHLTVEEVVAYTEVAEVKTTSERIASGFMESLRDVGNGFAEFFVGFVVNLPYILLILVLTVVLPGLIVFFIVRSIRKKRYSEKTVNS